VQKDDFYIPDAEPEPTSTKRSISTLPPIRASDSPTKSPMKRMQTSQWSNKSLTGLSVSSVYSGSVYSGSERDRVSDAAREKQIERDWENFAIRGDSEDEDEIMRRMLPRAMEVEMSRRRDSRKALKWLGLA
jgi:hypothetical protein